MTEQTFYELANCRLVSRNKIITDTVNLEDCERTMQLWDSTQMSTIASAVKVNGGETTKPLFSNAEARSAELLIRQDQSPEYKALFEESRDLKTGLAIARAEVESCTAMIDFAIANAGDPDRIAGEIKTYVSSEVNEAIRRAFATLVIPPDVPK